MKNDRNIYFKIQPFSFDFFYQGNIIAQFLELEETIAYIIKDGSRKYKGGF
jgi:hypothetical protein